LDFHHPEFSVDLQRRIDQLCDQAEVDWRSGKEPEIERMIADVGIDCLAILVKELV
jgi:hypothetical protein